jgi:hypothetical protein
LEEAIARFKKRPISALSPGTKAGGGLATLPRGAVRAPLLAHEELQRRAGGGARPRVSHRQQGPDVDFRNTVLIKTSNGYDTTS